MTYPLHIIIGVNMRYIFAILKMYPFIRRNGDAQNIIIKYARSIASILNISRAINTI